MHLFWCVVLGAAVWAICMWRPALLRPFGVVLFLAAAAATAGIVGKDLDDWLRGVPGEFHRYWPRRVAYTIATLTDVPLVQALVAGAACVALGRRTPRSGGVERRRELAATKPLKP
jgi:hypothetical protein